MKNIPSGNREVMYSNPLLFKIMDTNLLGVNTEQKGLNFITVLLALNKAC
jgi:hypothetical protein